MKNKFLVVKKIIGNFLEPSRYKTHETKQTNNRKENKMKTNKTYTFAVPCSYVYEIEAETQEKAKEILMEKGGYDISGELCLESEDYKNATCLDKEIK